MNINNKKLIGFIFYIIILITNSSCSKQIERQPSSITLQPTKPDLNATTCPTMTPTSTPLTEGVIYKVDDEYWQLARTPFFIGTKDDLSQRCQNLTGFLETKQYCSDEYTNKSNEVATPIFYKSVIKLENKEDYVIWFSEEWVGNPGYYLLEVQPGKELMGMGYQTMPASIKYDGTEFTLIGHAPDSTGPHALSRDGQTLAFDENGVPWIYHPGQKPIELLAAGYGLQTLEGSHFSSPSFSFNDQTLVWSVYGYKDSTPIEGIAIFNLNNQTSELITPINIWGIEVPHGVWGWSPNSQYFFLVNDFYDVIYILDINGNVIHQLPHAQSMVWFTWNPSSNAVIITYTDWDGLYENWVFVIDSHKFYKMLLPEKAMVLDWVD